MKSKITILLSLMIVGLMFSCDNLNQNIESGDIDLVTIVDDEIVSLKSGEIGDEDVMPVTFGCNSSNFRFRMMNHRFDSDCLTVSSSGDDYPKEIIIDYGDGCEGRHGLVRTGKIIITMSDDILNEGAIHEVKYEDVTMGDRQIEMSKIKTNTGQNADGNWVIESSVEQTITYEDGSTSARNSTAASEWLSGFGTEDREDDMFMRTGSGTVVTSEGAEYTRDITTALLFDRSCLYIKSGVIELNKDGSEVIIDFGDGECDQWATVTTDGVSEIIDLSLRGRGMRGFRGKGR
ncbi:MAG: hypothetical protein U9N86_05875 [Bacteroidota bacterium]|nr:hypothetical protein [Bacteroidota bacterium]